MVSQKKDKTPETKLNIMEYCNLTEREFKIAVMKKLNELQQNSERQFNELRSKINKQNEYLTKEIETKKNQIEILELKNSINEMKTTLEIIGNNANSMEERISELEDRNLEMIQV